jgi:hypothetical protein
VLCVVPVVEYAVPAAALRVYAPKAIVRLFPCETDCPVAVKAGLADVSL